MCVSYKFKKSDTFVAQFFKHGIDTSAEGKQAYTKGNWQLVAA